MIIGKMAASGDITYAQDDHRSVKLHPYLVTLLRWCASYIWSAAGLILHRLMTSPLPPITAPKPTSSKQPKARLPGTDHLHPEPKVECVVLHQPSVHKLDVIFVHGLYGSLGNTWRQGDWRTKYKIDPSTVPLRRQNSLPTPCSQKTKTNEKQNENDYHIHHEKIINKQFSNETHVFNYNDRLHDRSAFKRVEEKFYADIENIITKENADISEKFYNHLLDKVEIVDNYETQAKFIQDLFKKEIHCDNNCDCTKDGRMTDGMKANLNQYTKDTMAAINDYVNRFGDINANEYASNNFDVEFNRYLNKEMETNINRYVMNNVDNKITNYGSDAEINIYDNRYDEQMGADIKECTTNQRDGDNNIIRHRSNKMERDINEYANETEGDINRYETNEDLKKNVVNENVCICRATEKCEVGCGCICDECYSLCWPRDWIKTDYPDARIISINYTSDPHLWRPLWVKENKRLRLHERAEQMTQQLLELGVGEQPIIWVGHSKGGLFIKQIYCEAYEAYLKQNDSKVNPDHVINNNENQEKYKKHKNNGMEQVNVKCNENKATTNSEVNEMKNIDNKNNVEQTIFIDNINEDKTTNNVAAKKEINMKDNKNRELNFNSLNKNYSLENETRTNNDKVHIENIDSRVSVNEKRSEIKCNKIDVKTIDGPAEIDKLEGTTVDDEVLCKGGESDGDAMSSNKREDLASLEQRSSLWIHSAGFMFYSVPHRGSPLADIKMPITARSVELLEISKDCPLVLSLQERWLQATSHSQPAVRSLVETCRTLMSVLYLRIVSVDSADAGIGALCGVSVDHREICKPSSRTCLLYTELMNLIHAALNRCDCNTQLTGTKK